MEDKITKKIGELSNDGNTIGVNDVRSYMDKSIDKRKIDKQRTKKMSSDNVSR